MSGKLNQINITFNPTEDRLLFRMTAGANDQLSEFRVWLTRRYVKLLWSVLKKMLEENVSEFAGVTPQGRDAYMQFEQEKALKQTDFKTSYAPRDVKTPLGEEPFLATRIQVRKASKGIHTLSMQNDRGPGININMPPPLVHSIRKLLAEAVAIAQWDLNLSLYEDDTALPSESSKLLN